MGNGDGPQPGGRSNWPVDLAGAVGAGTGVALALWLGPLTGLRGFWLGMLAIGVAVAVGIVVGRLVGSRMFRRPPGSGPRA